MRANDSPSFSHGRSATGGDRAWRQDPLSRPLTPFRGRNPLRPQSVDPDRWRRNKLRFSPPVRRKRASFQASHRPSLRRGARGICIKWYSIDNFLPKREDGRSLISMPDRTPAPSGAMILSLPRPSRADGGLDVSGCLAAGGRPFSGAHGERRRVKIKLAQLPSRPAARPSTTHSPSKDGRLSTGYGWSPSTGSLARHGGGGERRRRHSSLTRQRGGRVAGENRKWRRISLKTLETDSEMADPEPRLAQDQDKVLVMAAQLGSDDFRNSQAG